MRLQLLRRQMASAAVLALFTTAGFAAGETGATGQSGMTEQQPGEQAAQQQAPDMAQAYQASQLLDTQIQNPQNQELGSISDLVVDQDGRVSHVVLDTGGMFGGGEQYAVPWDRITLQPDQQVAILDVQEDQISAEFAAFEPQQQPEQQQQPQEQPQQPQDQGSEGM